MVIKIVVGIVIAVICFTLWACCKAAGDADKQMGIK